MNRKVILHYHLFKNAGTSVDRMLQSHFGDRWVTQEFPTNTQDNSAQVADWIRSSPGAVAFSTHTALGPVPQVEGVQILTVLMLRDPLARIRSAYRFEAGQDSDTWGAQLAKQHDLEGYVTARLERQGDRQCRDFQVNRLAGMVPGPGPELERAKAALRQISVLGLVEHFDGVTQRLNSVLRPHFPGFQAQAVRANTTRPAAASDADRRVDAMLREANAGDIALWKAAQDLLGHTPAPQV